MTHGSKYLGFMFGACFCSLMIGFGMSSWFYDFTLNFLVRVVLLDRDCYLYSDPRFHPVPSSDVTNVCQHI